MAALSDQQLYDLTNRHFGDLGQGVVNSMFKIALRESGGNPSAYNGVGMDNSWGLWQINTISGANPDMLKYDLYDPEQNARAAREIFNRAGPTAWSTYNPATDIGFENLPYGGGGSMQNLPYDPNNPGQVEELGGGDPITNLDLTINALMENMPQPGDYQDEVQNGVVVASAAEAYSQAIQDWQATISSMISIKQAYTEEDAGIFRMDDNSIITRAQMDSLDPSSRAQVEANIANRNIDRDNQYNQLMNDLGLTEFQTARSGVEAENARGSQDFQNNLASIRESIALDMANQDTSVKKIDRQLSGMAESRNRAATAMDALMKAAPWATSGGKTNFTAADLAMPEGVAAMGGFAPGADILKYPGMATIDPVGAMDYYDQQLGVTGQIPQVADLDPKWAGMIPQAPSSIPIPQGGFQGTPYQPYQPTPMPTTTPPDLGAVAAAIAQMFTRGGGGGRTAPASQSQRRPFPQMPMITPLTDVIRNQFGLVR